MEIVNIDIIGFYSYDSNLTTGQYNNCEKKYEDCIICKRSLYDPCYDIITDNKLIMVEDKIHIGKCGHMFHGECINKWLEKCRTCPIDKVNWMLSDIVDTGTCIVIDKKKYNKYNKK